MKRFLLFLCLFCACATLFGQTFVNDGEKVVYHVAQDASAQEGTVSDVLQNVPGVKVDTEGNVTLRGVGTVEIWINDSPSHFDEEGQKSYLQQTSAATIERIEVITNPSARYTSETDTGIINIITSNKKQNTQSLSVGLQANTNPHISPANGYGFRKYYPSLRERYRNYGKYHSFASSSDCFF